MNSALLQISIEMAAFSVLFSIEKVAILIEIRSKSDGFRDKMDKFCIGDEALFSNMEEPLSVSDSC